MLFLPCPGSPSSRSATAGSLAPASSCLPSFSGEKGRRKLAVTRIKEEMFIRCRPLKVTFMISELNIYRAADMQIERHGANGPVEAGRLINQMLELGNMEGRAVWMWIKRATERRRRRRSDWCTELLKVRALP